MPLRGGKTRKIETTTFPGGCFYFRFDLDFKSTGVFAYLFRKLLLLRAKIL